jgi:hypothetical protein
VEVSGHAGSGRDAMAYYARLAEEINSACDSGKLPALSRRATMQPPWDWNYFSPSATAFWKGARMLATFENFTTQVPRSRGDDLGMRWFTEVTRSPLATLEPPMTRVSGWAFSPTANIDLRVITSGGRPVDSMLRWLDSPELLQFYHSKGVEVPRAGHASFELSYPEDLTALLSVQAGGRILRVIPLDGQHTGVDQPDLQLRLNAIHLDADDIDVTGLKRLRIGVMNGMGAVYHVCTPVLVALAALAVLLQIIGLVLGRGSVWLLLTLSLLVAIVARLGLLALIDATSFPAITVEYLAPVYPLMLLFCVLALMDGSNVCSAFLRQHRRAAAVIASAHSPDR